MSGTGVDKAKVVGSAPILLVRDVVASANYYRDMVGFNYSRFWGEPPCFCILWRDGFHLMLSQVENPSLIAPNNRAVEDLWDLYLWVDDIEAIYLELQARGATIATPPHDQPHGCREFEVRDIDGHIVAFGQEID